MSKAVEIDWREAEKLSGRRLDRRVKYWRRDDKILVHAFVVKSMAEFNDAVDRCPFLTSGQGFARPVIERTNYDGRFSLDDLVEI